MTRLIVSVKNRREALLAHSAGVDLIDVKDPARGSLGAVDPLAAVKIVAELGGQNIPLSVSLGELIDLPGNADFSFVRGFQFAKVGMAGAGGIHWRKRLRELQAQMPIGSELVTTCYVDYTDCNAPDFRSILNFAFVQDVPAILFDTYRKSNGDLFCHCTLGEVADSISCCNAAGLKSVLAGSLNTNHLGLIHELQPDFIALRGAVCKPDRQGRLDPQLVQKWKQKLTDGTLSFDMKSPVALAY